MIVDDASMLGAATVTWRCHNRVVGRHVDSARWRQATIRWTVTGDRVPSAAAGGRQTEKATPLWSGDETPTARPPVITYTLRTGVNEQLVLLPAVYV